MRAILIDRDDDGNQRAELTEVDESGLPDGDVTIDVAHSTINYKDSLAITGSSPVVRSFPMVGGIDLAGTVTSSTSADVAEGSEVLVNGWGMGEVHWGGYASKARVPAAWTVPVPDGMSTHDTMAVGTAGYTAMLCVLALEDHGVTPDRGEVLVTGATGGVGSVAVSLLSTLGYTVAASTGKADEAGYLKELGATSIIDRAELSEKGRPLGKERWAGVVDSVGSHTLANALAQTSYGGTVAACGLAQGPDLPGTVMPFILRGVTLAGVDSVHCPRERRLQAWSRLGSDLDRSHLALMVRDVGLGDVIAAASDQMAGGVRGRLVVDVNT